uniref:Uncharacterized protein n=1 Tax=Arundo donax TaxID=35708 RepID=A0A0A8Y168_ARUDO
MQRCCGCALSSPDSTKPSLSWRTPIRRLAVKSPIFLPSSTLAKQVLVYCLEHVRQNASMPNKCSLSFWIMNA